MLSFEVVVGEVGTDLFQGCPMVFIFGHFQLGLDGSEARFNEGVVVAVACTAHALISQRAATRRGIPCLRIVRHDRCDESIEGLGCSTNRHRECGQYQGFGHIFA